MPIISNKKAAIQAIKFNIEEDLLKEVEEYCKVFKVDSKDHFFNESIKYLLSKDPDWKKYKKSQAKNESKN